MTDSRAEQSRAEQSRAEQSRAEQSRAEQSRAEQSRAEQSRAGFPTPFERLLADLRGLAKNTREYGGNFEVLTRQFLLTEPRYKHHYAKIELWADWTKQKDPQTGNLNWANSRDCGIDLVATRYDGKFCAIQCKFFLESRISKEMLNSFIAESGRAVFAERMFVATGGLSDNLEQALRAQEPPVLCLSRAVFEHSSIDWVNIVLMPIIWRISR